LDLKITAVASGVVGGNAGKAISPNIFWGNAHPPNDVKTRGNGDTLAFPK